MLLSENLMQILFCQFAEQKENKCIWFLQSLEENFINVSVFCFRKEKSNKVVLF